MAQHSAIVMHTAVEQLCVALTFTFVAAEAEGVAVRRISALCKPAADLAVTLGARGPSKKQQTCASAAFCASLVASMNKRII
jgi:hypothetical protein